MSERTSDSGMGSLGTGTWITIGFVVLGVACWLVARSLTDSRLVQFGALIGVGVVAPTLVNEIRSKRGR